MYPQLLTFVSLAILATRSSGQLAFTCFPGAAGAASDCTRFASTFYQTVVTATVRVLLHENYVSR